MNTDRVLALWSYLSTHTHTHIGYTYTLKRQKLLLCVSRDREQCQHRGKTIHTHNAMGTPVDNILYTGANSPETADRLHIIYKENCNKTMPFHTDLTSTSSFRIEVK